jgi:hypothetical protein
MVIPRHTTPRRRPVRCNQKQKRISGISRVPAASAAASLIAKSFTTLNNGKSGASLAVCPVPDCRATLPALGGWSESPAPTPANRAVILNGESGRARSAYAPPADLGVAHELSKVQADGIDAQADRSAQKKLSSWGSQQNLIFMTDRPMSRCPCPINHVPNNSNRIQVILMLQSIFCEDLW